MLVPTRFQADFNRIAQLKIIYHSCIFSFVSFNRFLFLFTSSPFRSTMSSDSEALSDDSFPPTKVAKKTAAKPAKKAVRNGIKKTKARHFSDSEDDDFNVLNGIESNSNNKRLSVERIYQKKSQLEHILLRPDTYIGSVEFLTQQMWVYDEEIGMNLRDVTFVPGLYKIFDEILVNAADNKQRDRKMDTVKIEINP